MPVQMLVGIVQDAQHCNETAPRGEEPRCAGRTVPPLAAIRRSALAVE